MAYCPGETLQSRLAHGPLTLAEIATIAAQISAGLAAAHAAGIVHCDLKPSNIMVGPDGHVRILDFGLATALDDRQQTMSRLTGSGTTVGTVAYMAPEQVRGEPVDERADVWAFGVTFYEMLTGRRPFDGANVFAIMQAALEGSPAPVRALRPDTPGEMAKIVDLALEKDRARRTLTARDIQGRVSEWQNAQSGSALHPSPAGLSRRWRVGLVAATSGCCHLTSR